MATITVRNAVKAYEDNDGSNLLVLDNIDITAKHQHFTCLLGPSGCGKSTLFNCISGLERLDDGEISYSDLDGKAYHNGQQPDLGYVFQNPRLLNWKTVAGNLEFALKGMDIPEDEWDDRISTYLELVGLEEFQDQHPLYLSGGQRQRVAIARALCIEPDVLLMDEPFSALDEITARNLRSDLLDIFNELDQTIVFITHDAQEAAYLSDTIVVMSDRPATIKSVIDNPLSRPRDLHDPELLELEEEIVKGLGVYD